ncbi:hypothetical protein CANARDRAFT_201537 [[Candida] arabinofermentans NRRL YB-2248]|uniref:Septin-type G domain-containing protein n=1 Tax=[Candida] arabinofermentans NRRL YB-2248 TaxID=983967 RepID=A0A1E4SXM5_9ASCO|nr:hypothetical protein CANARDRAFT_201537 [[Candida] arabinofermentans NRRL YB-2248]
MSVRLTGDDSLIRQTSLNTGSSPEIRPSFRNTDIDHELGISDPVIDDHTIKHRFDDRLRKIEHICSRYRFHKVPIVNYLILSVLAVLLLKLSVRYHKLYTKSSLIATIATNVVLYGIADTMAQSIAAMQKSRPFREVRSSSVYDISQYIRSLSNSNPEDTFVDYGESNRNNLGDTDSIDQISFDASSDVDLATEFKFRRFVCFIFWGFIMAFVQVMWYSFLNSMYTDMPSVVSVLERVLTDQLCFSPISLICFFTYGTIVIEQGTQEDVKAKLYKIYISTLACNFCQIDMYAIENPTTNDPYGDMSATGSTGTLMKVEEYPVHYNLSSATVNLLPGEIGLACLPILKRLHALKEGANFNMMVVGESGVGKSSFINTLFDTLVIEKKTTSPKPNLDKTTEIIPYKMELIEDNFHLRLTVIDTPGFGDYIDNRYCWYPIVRYIDEQYRRVVYQENQPDRTNLVNGAIHVCLYFIVPSATGLSQIDIESMKNLSARINLVPVISKADAFTVEELNAFRQRVQNTLKEHEISICELIENPGCASFTDDMPFSVINSIERFENSEKKFVRGRSYKWGLAEVENPAHCDFVRLREFLMGTSMADLISSTENYYENYRRDFMKYRLGKALESSVSDDEIVAIGNGQHENEVMVPESKGSWKSTTKKGAQPHPSINELIDTKSSTYVLNLLNTLNLKETEKELVELNPAYLESEKTMKKKFTEIVQSQNQKFKDWKRALFERQDKFNKDIEQIHKRLLSLQDQIKSLDPIRA